MKEQEENKLNATWETPEIKVVEINEQTNMDVAGAYDDGGLFSTSS